MKKRVIWAALLCGLVLVLGLFLGGCDNPADGDDGGGDTTAPGPVSGLGGSTGGGEVTLSWADPGDKDLDHIEITWTPGGFDPVSVAKGAGSKTIDGLTNNTWYTFSLLAVDASGNQSNSKTIMLVPGDLGLSAYPGKTQILVRWTDPTYPNFDHIEVTWQPGNGFLTVPAGRGFAAVSPLSPGEYTITVDTVNTSSEKSGGQSVTASTDPDAWDWRPALSPAARTAGSAFSGLVYSAYNSGRFLVSWSENATPKGIYYSSDGETWTLAGDSQFGSSIVYSIASNTDGSVLVAVGAEGKISRSTDGGASWTAVTGGNNPFENTDSILGAAFLNGQFAAFGAGGKMAWSTDGGVSWTLVSDTKFAPNNITSMAYGNGTYLAGGPNFDGSVRLATSTDRQAWTDITTAYGYTRVFGIAHNSANTFVALGTGRAIYSTDNGTSWTIVSGPAGIPTSNALNGIIWEGERFVAGGNSGRVIWSADGISWNLVPLLNVRGAFMNDTGGYANISVIAYGNGKYVIAGNHGALAYAVK
jgi:hypothetical protein